jgi:hypothetical protein
LSHHSHQSSHRLTQFPSFTYFITHFHLSHCTDLLKSVTGGHADFRRI